MVVQLLRLSCREGAEDAEPSNVDGWARLMEEDGEEEGPYDSEDEWTARLRQEHDADDDDEWNWDRSANCDPQLQASCQIAVCEVVALSLINASVLLS